MRRAVSGEFKLPVSAGEAIHFFTPDGGDVETIWVVQEINRNAYSSAYSRVTPGRHAGTVKVQCVDQVDGGCLVAVAYDMSLLPGSDPTGLDSYDDPSFAAMMEEWASGVATVLSH